MCYQKCVIARGKRYNIIHKLIIGTLKQGKRRLKRALKQQKFEADCDNLSSKESATPIVLNNVELHKELNNIQEINISCATNEIEDLTMLSNIDGESSTLEDEVTYGIYKDSYL